MTKPKEEIRTIELDPKPKGKLKLFRGEPIGQMGLRHVNLVGNSLPIDHSNSETSKEATKAVCQATADISRADPIEGILIAQLIAANEASLAMYRKGWAQPREYFEARTKYLQLADKAARTVMMLTERLVLAASSKAPMPVLDDTRLPDLVGVGGGTKTK